MATWTTPSNWSGIPNNKVTAALLNTHLKENMDFLAGFQLGQSERLSEIPEFSELRLRNVSVFEDTDEVQTNSTEMVQVGAAEVQLTTTGGPVLIVANFDEKVSGNLFTGLWSVATGGWLGTLNWNSLSEYHPNILVRIHSAAEGPNAWQLRFSVGSDQFTGYIKNIQMVAMEIA